MSAPVSLAAACRADFPILDQRVNGKPLCFLDSAASAQKPRQVIDTLRDTYETCYANVHRGAYSFSERTTAAYEGARAKLRTFLYARSAREIIFTGNATAAINLVAHAFGRGLMRPGDEVIISEMEHHANIVPWQLLRDATGVVMKVTPIADDGAFLMDPFVRLLTSRTRLVAVTHVSNVLGTVTPLDRIIPAAHDAGARVLVDGSQGVVHGPVDVQALDCDFYAFTGHKLYGPSGVGVLYGKEALLDMMPPFMGGGDMISRVTFEKSVWADLPAKFEAGTPPIVQAIGLGAAVDYLTGIGMARVAAHEQDLLAYATDRLAAVNGLRLVGTAAGKGPILSFTLENAHPHDIATILDQQGVAVRAGHHCAEPLMRRMGVSGTTRASFALYNSRADVDALVTALQKVTEIFRP